MEETWEEKTKRLAKHAKIMLDRMMKVLREAQEAHKPYHEEWLKKRSDKNDSK